MTFALALAIGMQAAPAPWTRLKGLDAIEVFMVTVPKEFAGQPDVPTNVELKAIVDHRFAADKVPTVSFVAVANDLAKLDAYQAKKKAHLIVDVQLVLSGDAFAYNVLAQVVEDAKIVRTGSSILTPIWSKAVIGVADRSRLKAAIRDQVVDEIDDLAADLASANVVQH